LWLTDPGNSRWIVFGGSAGVAESHGLAIREHTGEGDLRPATAQGVPGARSVTSDGRPGFFYLVAEPWQQFRAWLGEDHEVLLSIRYFDGAAGNMLVSYDSSDPRVKFDPYPAGVWRKPDAIPNGQPLSGDRKWKTLRLRLPLAFFAKRVHNADFRVDGHSPDFLISGVAVTRVPKEKAAAPAVRPLRVGESVGPESFRSGPRVVENSRLAIEVDPYGIQSIVDRRSGVPVVKAAELHDALASLVLKKPGAVPTFSRDLYRAALEKCEVGGSAESPRLTLTHRLDPGLRLAIAARLLPDGQSEWQMAVDNPTGFEVAEFRFPVVSGIRLGGDPAETWLFVPKCWGQVTKNPAADPTLSSSAPCTPMRWAALWDGRQGICFGIEDPRGEDYCFHYGGDSSGGVTIAPWQRTLVKPHSRWKSGIFRIALTRGDWHEAADIYRQYAARTLRPPAVHPYLKWLVDTWCYQPANDAPSLGWDMIHPGGEMLMAANRQMLDGPDAGYCGLYPYPAPAWGSTREFSQKLAVRRALGGFYTPYLNTLVTNGGCGHGRRIATFPVSRLPADALVPKTDWYRQNAAYAYDGTYLAIEDRAPFYAECPMAMGSRGWRQWLADWTLRYLHWGADGMYYDQFNFIAGNGRLYPDFDTYGCWAPATLELITRVRQAARRKNAYYTSSGEICNDIYGQQLDLHMTSGVWNRLEFFRYCVPQQLLIDGWWNAGFPPEAGGPERGRFIWQVGARFEGPPPDPRLVPLRRTVKSLLYDATFRDTVGLVLRDAAGVQPAVEHPYSGKWQNAAVKGLLGRWFLVDQDGQRGAIVNLINAPLRKGATCGIRTESFGPVAFALAVTIDGARRPLAGRQEGHTFTFPVPEAECSSVILAVRLAPLVEWHVEPAAAPGVVRKLALKLTNPNAQPLCGTAALRLPAGWETPRPKSFGPIEPGQSRWIELALAVPAGAARGRTDVWCDVRTPLGNFSAYSLLVVNDPVVADLRGNPGGYHLWLKNLTGHAQPGSLSVAGQDGLRASAPEEFTIGPEAELRVPVAVSGQDRLRQISQLAATVKIGGQTVRLVRGVMPTVPNGDFESDAAGDGKPDWWMCRKVRDDWAYDRLHLAGAAHGGRYCLRLDPPEKGEQFTCAYPVHGALRPGARYRASVWIKSESPRGVRAQVAGQSLGSGRTTPQWQHFTGEFVQGNTPAAWIGLYNESPAPAFFDDLAVEETATP
jgi:hypothetical protein